MSIDTKEGDFILVLCHFLQENGAIREEFKLRLGRAVYIWYRRRELIIVVNGGLTQGTPRSQGLAAFIYLRGLGVPESNILWTEEGHDTFEELNIAQEIMKKRGWKMPIVVSNWMQLTQVSAVFFRLGIDWLPSATKLSVPREDMLLYVFQRIIAYFISLIDPHGKLLEFLRRGRKEKWGQKI